MPKPWLLDIENRAVFNCRVFTVQIWSDRFALYVTNMDGEIVWTVYASSLASTRHQLNEVGYRILPRYAAFDLDEATR